MCEVCESPTCNAEPAKLCWECLEETILHAVAKALESNLAALTKYHQAKRRSD